MLCQKYTYLALEFVGKRYPGIEVRDIDTSQTLIMQKFDTMHTDAYNA